METLEKHDEIVRFHGIWKERCGEAFKNSFFITQLLLFIGTGILLVYNLSHITVWLTMAFVTIWFIMTFWEWRRTRRLRYDGLLDHYREIQFAIIDNPDNIYYHKVFRYYAIFIADFRTDVPPDHIAKRFRRFPGSELYYGESDGRGVKAYQLEDTLVNLVQRHFRVVTIIDGQK